jgi:proteasome lid subunit RPN8/RPN11
LHIQMNKSFYHILLEYSLRKLPEEACGFIVGTVQNNILTASTFVPITNIAHNLNESFVMDPIEVMHSLNSQTKQSQIVGIFHTHPSAEALLSQEDLQTLWHTLPSHWILSLLQPEAPKLRIYKLKKNHPVSYHKLPFAID